MARLSMTNLRLSMRLILLLGVFAVGFVCFATVSFVVLKHVQVNGPIYSQIVQNKDLVADILPPPEYIIESYLVTLQMQSEPDALLLQGMAKRCGQLHEEYLERHQLWVNELEEGPMKDWLVNKSYEPAIAFYKVCNEQFLPTLLAGQREESAKILEQQLKPLYNQHRAAIDEVVKLANEQLGQQEANARSTVSANTLYLSVIASLCLLGSAVFAWLVTRSILRPMKLIIHRVRDIAEGEGDLTKRVDIDSHDEIGTLAQLINRFIQKLQELIGDVSASAHEVATTATQIAASGEQMAAAIKQQSQQAGQISSAVEQLSASVTEVARKSSEASGNAEQSGSAAAEGGRIVQETIDGMKSINEAVSSSSVSVQALGRRGEQIGQIIEVINDIADQTNLLALNAAIEAARAGEHGKGFAVVADEVRKLADRTTKATGEVSESITAIQTETTQAVQRMNHGTEQVKTGVEHATEAGLSLQQIVSSTSDVANMIQSIAAAVEQQSAASEQITQNIETISLVSRQSSDGAEQTAQAALQMSQKAEHLLQIVGKFRVKRDGADQRAQPDFASIRTAHLKWRTRLRDFLDGKQALSTAQATSHRECELGKWLYGHAMQSYSDNPHMHQLEQLHEQLHNNVRRIIELKHAGKVHDAERALMELSDQSHHVIDLLNQIEADLKSYAKAA